MKSDWWPFELLLKGLFLGLSLFGATALGFTDPVSWQNLVVFALAPWVGLFLALGATALTQRAALSQSGGWVAKIGYLALEFPQTMYAGIVLGGAMGAFSLASPLGEVRTSWFLLFMGVALALGLLLASIRFVPDRLARVVLLTMAGFLVAGCLVWLFLWGIQGFASPPHPALTGLAILLSLPAFHLLGFLGYTDESEGEFALVCTLGGVGLWLLPIDHPAFRAVVSMGPALLYIVYTARFLPAIQVFKQAFRGFNLEKVGKKKSALLAYRKALGSNPKHSWAAQCYWNLHRNLDVATIRTDPDWHKLVDARLCLQRAGEMLGGNKPSSESLLEAKALLGLVKELRPTLDPTTLYWEAIADLHQGQTEDAATKLQSLLDTDRYAQDNAARAEVLVQAWLLALIWHPKLRVLVGEPELGKPHRRMEAIRAMDAHLDQVGKEPDVWSLKRILYSDLTEADYRSGLDKGWPAGSLCDVNYLEEIGKAKLDDPADWRKGMEWLRIASLEKPQESPRFWVEIAKAAERHGDTACAKTSFEEARDSALKLGWKNLSEPARTVFFKVVKYLAELASFETRWDEALKNWSLYSECAESGLETQRQIAQAHEALGEPLPALLAVEKGLVYSPKDADLLARKDRYYFSVEPGQLAQVVENVRPFFDANYCLRQAQRVLSGQLDGPEWTEVAGHLLELLLIVSPQNLPGRVAMARFRLKLGERAKALEILESVRADKPTSWISGTDEESWDQANQILGDLYLEVGKPREALACLIDFRKTSKSGTRTLWKMGQAFEALGETQKALSAYEQITAYEGNSLEFEAREAIRRIKEASSQSGSA